MTRSYQNIDAAAAVLIEEILAGAHSNPSNLSKALSELWDTADPHSLAVQALVQANHFASDRDLHQKDKSFEDLQRVELVRLVSQLREKGQ